MQNLENRSLKQTYHKPEFQKYGSVSVLTANTVGGPRCDNPLGAPTNACSGNGSRTT